MKAYKSPDSDEPRLFRPDKNMARLNRSAARVSLPVSDFSFPTDHDAEGLTLVLRFLRQTFDPDALLSLITTLVSIDKAYVPAPPATLYIRPTMLGTRPSIQTGPSDDCLLYVM